jgi:ATP-dependent DNA helicase RecG
MRDSTDGFRLAEIDMEIRGPGDLWGTMQSGFPELRVADLVRDGDILRDARDLAFRIVDEDPQLRAPEHEPILRLLGPVLRARMRMARIA